MSKLETLVGSGFNMMGMSKRQAMIALLNGDKVAHESMAQNCCYEMDAQMKIYSVSETGQKVVVSGIMDGNYLSFVKTVKKVQKGFISVSTVANLSIEENSKVVTQFQKEPNKFSYIPAEITWLEEAE